MALPAASITVNDGAATPQSQTFSIVDRTGFRSEYRNAAATLVRGSQLFKHEVRLGANGTAANRVIGSLSYPIEGTVEGQTTVVRSGLLKFELNFAQGSSEVERSTAYGLLVNLLAQADVKAASTKLVSLG